MMIIISKKRLAAAIAMLCALIPTAQGNAANKTKTDYKPQDYVWTSQSENSAGSMPCGGHDVGMNVWVENGDVLFYLSKSGMLDENNTLLKAGRFRLKIDGQPFCGNSFEQRLSLDDGAIYIKGDGTKIRIWADVYQPKVFVEIISAQKRNATLSYESWIPYQLHGNTGNVHIHKR